MHKLVNLVSDVHFSLCKQYKTPEYLQAIPVVCCVDCENLGVNLYSSLSELCFLLNSFNFQ
jgi:hypothetical protein